jgi:hypothetical protein
MRQARRRKPKWYENPSVRKNCAGSSPAARTIYERDDLARGLPLLLDVGRDRDTLTHRPFGHHPVLQASPERCCNQNLFHPRPEMSIIAA